MHEADDHHLIETYKAESWRIEQHPVVEFRTLFGPVETASAYLWKPGEGHGVRPMKEVRAVFGDPKARVITLVWRSKNEVHVGWYDRKTRRVRDLSCGKVKREHIDFLADNPLYTKRFAWYAGRRCRPCENIKIYPHNHAKGLKIIVQPRKRYDIH